MSEGCNASYPCVMESPYRRIFLSRFTGVTKAPSSRPISFITGVTDQGKTILTVLFPSPRLMFFEYSPKGLFCSDGISFSSKLQRQAESTLFPSQNISKAKQLRVVDGRMSAFRYKFRLSV